MVEELKLAVKVDDDIIEQSLLKQFNNAEKLADKVVFTFKNVNLDNKEIEKQFKDMQKLAGKNPIELPIDTDKSLKMLQALGDEFTRIISIAKGTSFKPSSLFNQLIDISDIKKGSDELNSALASAMQRMKDLYDSGQKESVEYYATLYKIIEIQKKMWQFNGMGKKSSFDSAPNVKDASERMKLQDDIFDDFRKYSGAASDTVDFVIQEFSRLKSLGEGIFGENGKILSKSMVSSLMDLQFNGSVIELLEIQEKQALATAEAHEKLAKAQKDTSSTVPIKDTFQGDTKASTESSAPAIKDEAKAMEQVAESAEKASKSKDEFAKANKKVKESADSSSKAVSEEATEFNKIIGKLDGYQKKLDSFKVKPTDGHRYPIYQKNINELNEYIDKLQTLSQKDINLIKKEDVSEAQALQKEIDELIFKMSKMSASEKGFDPLGADKALEKIYNELQKNSGMSKEAKRQIQGYYDEIRSGNPSKPIKDLLDDMYKLIQLEREAGRAHKSFKDIFKEKVVYGAAANMAGMIGIYDIINAGREGINVIRELDTALVDLKKTTSMTSNELNQFYIDANESAKEYGVTTQEIIDQASSWSRLGYSSKEESTMMAELSSKFAAISPEMDAEQAQSGMVSIMKAWGIEVEQAEDEIISKINSLGNNFALSNADLVEGMQRSAAALAATGTTWTDAFALFTGAQEVLQNSEVAGRALRSISMRIHGYSEDSEDGLMELDEELTNITGDLIDLTKTAEHSQGVSIFKEGSTTEFKSLVDYFGEINAIWDEMSQKQQNDFLQKAFGKTQANLCLYVQKCA